MRNIPYCFQPGSKPQTEKIVPEIVPDSMTESLTVPSEERQTIVHCNFMSFPGAMIRIWRTTFLIPNEDPNIKIPLLHAENICFAPHWYQIDGYGIFTFSLIFGGLPASCKSFDLLEEISQPGAFSVKGIMRNQSDIYHVNL